MTSLFSQLLYGGKKDIYIESSRFDSIVGRWLSSNIGSQASLDSIVFVNWAVGCLLYFAPIDPWKRGHWSAPSLSPSICLCLSVSVACYHSVSLYLTSLPCILPHVVPRPCLDILPRTSGCM